MTDSPVVGSASFELRATKDKLKQDLAEAERDLKQATGSMEGEVNRSTAGISGGFARMGGAISTGIVAIVALLATAVAGMTKLSFSALRMADDIANTARKVGVGTTALQEWRHVAQQTGATAQDADRALDSFATKLAQATAGTSKEAVKAFALLQIGSDQLKSFKSTEDALDHVTDAIKNLKSEADRAAVAEALGLGPLSNALRDSSVDVAKLRDEARALGLVLDEAMVRRASEAQGEIDTLARIIDVQLKGAFIDLAPAILQAISLVAQFAASLGDALDSWRQLDTRTARGLQREDQRLAREQLALINAAGAPGHMQGAVRARRVEGEDYTVVGMRDRGGAKLPSAVNDPTLNFWENQARNGRGSNRVVDVYAQEHFDALNSRREEIAKELQSRAEITAPVRTDRPTGTTITLPPSRTPVDRSAEREARRAERIEQEIFRARQRLLQVAEGDILTAQQRFDLAQEQLKMDRQARDAEIESKANRGEIKASERRQLEAANASADALEDRVMADNAFREIQDERLANEKLLAGLTADLLSLQSGAARTAKERQRIELEMLEIAQQQRREALRLQLDRNPSLTATQRNDAMAQNGRIDAAERDAVLRNTLSPLERWRDESLKTAGEIAEAYENVAARGLDALNDGLVDAIMNTRSLGGVFSAVAKQILADPLSISVRRGITEPLGDMLFGGGSSGSGGGGLFSGLGSWLKGKIPGFASGVQNFGGGLAYVHAGEILANLPQGTDVIPAHAVQATGSKGGTQVFDMRGAVVTADLLADVNRQVAAGTATAIRSSATIARKGAAAVQQQQRRLGTT